MESKNTAVNLTPVINFARGAPPLAFVANLTTEKMLGKAADHLWRQEGAENSLGYGSKSGGNRYLNELAKFLSSEYKDNVNPDSLFLTCGATYGLHLTSTVFFKAGATVFVEDPTYFCAIEAFKNDFAFNVVPVPTNEGGIDINIFETLLKENNEQMKENKKDNSLFNGMLYIMPVLNNPTTRNTLPSRCHELIRLARKYDILLFCDDVYNLLYYNEDSAAPPRLLTYDKRSDPDYKGHVISNGTFSKILGLGIRLGWIETSERIINSLASSALLWSSGSVNHFVSELIASTLQMNIQQENLIRLRQYHKDLLPKVYEAMRKHFPPSVIPFKSEGGYFIWIKMPKDTDADELARIAMDEFRLSVISGSMTSPTGGWKNFVRISYGLNDEEVVFEGIRRLGLALHKYFRSIYEGAIEV